MKEIIKEIYKENTHYKYPNQAVNQAESLDKLSSDIYSESQRFIYELIQNADDAAEGDSVVKIELQILANYLIVSHNGKPFSPRDMKGLCGVGNGTKRKDANKTGYKGIGFKSVFGQSELVYVRTEDQFIKFDKEEANNLWLWENTKNKWSKDNDRDFSMPWQIIPFHVKPDDVPSVLSKYNSEYTVSTIIKFESTTAIEEDILSLLKNAEVILFLRKVVEIKLCGTKGLTINKNISNEITDISVNDEISSSWISMIKELNIPGITRKELKKDSKCPKKLQEVTSTAVTIAIPVKDGQIINLPVADRLLYTYLPTSVNCNLPFLVNANFLTDAGRQKLHNDAVWNNWLIEQIPPLMINWISELSCSKYRKNYLSVLPKSQIKVSSKIDSSYSSGFTQAVEEIAFILNDQDKLLKVNDILIDRTNISINIGKQILLKYINSSKDKSFNEESVIKDRAELNNLSGLQFTSFDKDDLDSFFVSDIFTDNHKLTDNFSLICFLHEQYTISSSDVQKAEWKNKLESLPFIFDEDKKLRSPKQLYLKSLEDVCDDKNVFFAHNQIDIQVKNNIKVLDWLKDLGLDYKSDVSFIEKSIIEDHDYVTIDNAIEVGRVLLDALRNNKLTPTHLENLRGVKTLSTEGKLVAAQDAYLSNIYQPKLDLENHHQNSFYISEKYIGSEDIVSDWKSLFVKIGVQESITWNEYDSNSFKKHPYYPTIYEKYFELKTGFPNYEYANLISSYRINKPSFFEYCIDNNKFSRLFWKEAFKNLPATSGNYDKGYCWFYGTKDLGIIPYFKWAVLNIPIIPTTQNTCLKAECVYRNTNEIRDIAADYLPVFAYDKPIPEEWAELLNLKEQLKFEDYLSILSSLSNESTGPKNDEIDSLERRSRISKIYKKLISEFLHRKVELSNWASVNKTLTKNGVFKHPTYLNYYLDIDSNKNIDDLIYVDKDDVDPVKLKEFLEILGVTVYTKDNCTIDYNNLREDTSLRSQISSIIPYLAEKINYESQKGFKYEYSKLRNKVDFLKINCASKISQLINGELIESPASYLDFDKKELIYTGDWRKERILYSITSHLAPYLRNRKITDAIGFLLREDDREEIDLWLNAENIKISEECKSEIEHIERVRESIGVNDHMDLTDSSIGINKDMILSGDQKDILSFLSNKGIIDLEMLNSFLMRSDFYDENTATYASGRHIDKEKRYEAHKIAYNNAKEKLELEAYKFTGEYKGSVVDGVIKEGIEYPMVIKSYANSNYELNITPGEWMQLAKDNSIFILSKADGQLCKLELDSLLSEKKRFHMEFMPEAFGSKEALNNFIRVFYEKRIKGVRFQISVPTELKIANYNELCFNKEKMGVLPAESDSCL